MRWRTPFKHSFGLTDQQISELQTKIHDHYTQIHTCEEEIKEQKTELLYIQVTLSIAVLDILLNQEDRGNSKSDDLKNAEEKLLEAVSCMAEDQPSLEKVKAYSKQVYKAAEQKIRKGEPQYMVDFFVGLQIHCGAVTALHGDKEFGIKEIKSYEGILSECILTERVLLLTQPTLTGESHSSDTTPVPGFVG